MVALSQFAPPAMAGPDVSSAERDGIAGVVVAHICGLEDHLQVIGDISLQPHWPREPERLSVREVLGGLHPSAGLGSCSHLRLEKIIKMNKYFLQRSKLPPVPAAGPVCRGSLWWSPGRTRQEQSGLADGWVRSETESLSSRAGLTQYLLVIGSVEQDSMEDDVFLGRQPQAGPH